MALESKRNALTPKQPLKKVDGVPRELSQVQRNVEQATQSARDMPQTRGRRVTVTAAAAGDVLVSHGLGRKPRGWNVESKSAAVDVYEQSGTANTRTIKLNVSGAAQVTLWMY